MYEARTHGSVRGMMLDLIIQHHPTRLQEGGQPVVPFSARFILFLLNYIIA